MSKHHHPDQQILGDILETERSIKHDEEEGLFLEFAELTQERRQLLVQIAILRTVRRIESLLRPTLTRIQIAFTKGTFMATPVPGPITLTAVGQSAVATVLGFDQF